MKVHCKHDALVQISQLKPHPKNRNVHSAAQVDRLAKLLDYYGVRAPIVVSKRTGFIVKGHGTLMAIQKNKWQAAPVVYQPFETDEEEYGFLQADNAIAAWAELDLENIKLDLKTLDKDFDLELLGFEEFQLDEETKEEDEDSVGEPPVEPKVRLGDLWRLGEHRIICGDCTVKENVERLMNGEKADMVFTDPPYGVGYIGIHEGIHGAGTHRRKELKGDENEELISRVPHLLSLNCDGPIYLFCGAGKETALLNAIEKSNLERISVLIWNKPKGSFALNANYKPTFEMFFYLKTENSDRRWAGSHTEWTVWDFSKEGGNKLHPTQKPIQLIEKAILNHTAKTILDPFLGSGSTLIACEKTNRKCYGMEIDPQYCDGILDRWEKYSKKDAIREDGKLWKEVKNGTANKPMASI